MLLDIAGSMISVECWGIKASNGHLLLAAHYLKIFAEENTAGGPIASRSLGKISESYSVAPQADGELATTKFGLLYLALRKTLFLLPISGRTAL